MSRVFRRINWGDPGWIMVAMWWLGVIFAACLGEWLGAAAISLIAGIRTWVTYEYSKVEEDE